MRNVVRWGAAVLAAAVALAIPGPAAAAGRTLVWSDEFDGAAGSAPDPGKWNHDVGGDGWGNKELEYYTDSTRNAALDGEGHLNITARSENPEGASCWYGACRYSSARLTTKGKFEQQNGRFEARMRLPHGKGMWPAFWMLGADFPDTEWPGCGEIDIMENIGSEPTTVNGTLHGPGYSDDNGPGGKTTASAPLSDDFHVYAVEWSGERITWFFDDHAYLTLTRDNIPSGARWAFDHPFFLLLNLAVGGSWPGDPGSDTAFPQNLTVDYVRVFR
ncbi:glycoside hydrolase family 16 protein [Amycolatopsis jejuensis]|uniref:glycoside hydrolase family 16 protein n=1 Tax=Amycolatopsis jejuensis TaxID=330084 RepID=UPI000527B4D0|nr:glycoside hydrolase family 16 protein [Amycolatopsis jejuensis]